jgi:hypothetical protein
MPGWNLRIPENSSHVEVDSWAKFPTNVRKSPLGVCQEKNSARFLRSRRLRGELFLRRIHRRDAARLAATEGTRTTKSHESTLRSRFKFV